MNIECPICKRKWSDTMNEPISFQEGETILPIVVSSSFFSDIKKSITQHGMCGDCYEKEGTKEERNYIGKKIRYLVGHNDEGEYYFRIKEGDNELTVVLDSEWFGMLGASMISELPRDEREMAMDTITEDEDDEEEEDDED